MSLCSVKCCGFKDPVSTAECLEHAASRQNSCPYTFELLNVMYGQQQDRGKRISTTTLTSKCMRSEWFKRTGPYTDDPKKLFASFRGTLLHGSLEKAVYPTAIAEARYWVNLDGLGPFSGSPDLVDLLGVMYDYKTCKEVPKFDYPWPDHKMQMFVNRWLVDNADEVEVKVSENETKLLPLDDPKVRASYVPREWDSLVLVYIDNNGSKPITVTKSETVIGKNGRSKNVRVPDLGDDEVIEAYIRENYAAWQEAFESPEPPPIPEGFEYWDHPLCGFCPVKKECVMQFIKESA